MIALTVQASAFVLSSKHAVSLSMSDKESVVVRTALGILESDLHQVLSADLKRTDSKAQIIVATRRGEGRQRLDQTGLDLSWLDGQGQAFILQVTPDGRLVIAGSDSFGTAYGIIELTRLLGVSPWEWWADVDIEPRSELRLEEDFVTRQSPNVTFRGIFINDEDWGLMPWSATNYEPSTRGQIGPKTTQRIFELMLRLRANLYWPPMHPCTHPFFLTEGCRELAVKYGVSIGTSHCEPIGCNAASEWKMRGKGDYNWDTNRTEVLRFWEQRVKETARTPMVYTLGMRGIHDGPMQGIATVEAQKLALQDIFQAQREMLAKYVNPQVNLLPQVFIPYKEVLDAYEAGLQVPDDVTLLWPDDNYGYIRHFPNDREQSRKGGNGVYYHASYWGRPHDYMWLTTTQPGLIYSEMKAAYDHNCRKLWIVNVHDPKVAAYDLEFFLDMAWNINSIQPNTINQHLERWLCTQFGDQAGKRLAPAMREFYRLCGIRRPVFMGWTQVELSDRKAYPRGRSHVIDTDFQLDAFGGELERYLADYAAVCQTVEAVEQTISPELKDAFFANIKYPVFAANAMAVKMLEAQKARSKYQGQTDKDMEGRDEYMMQASARSMAAYRQIQKLTDYYNTELSDGKWQGIMNMMPRDLPVFNPPTVPYLPTEDYPIKPQQYTSRIVVNEAVAMNASQYSKASEGCQPIQMLGHSMQAVAIPKGGELTYRFQTDQEGVAILYTAMIPTQPNDKGDIRYQVILDGQEPVTISLKEKYRSDFWKFSVLRGQALKQTNVHVGKGIHTLTIRALDEHIILDQWMLDFQTARKFYMLPLKP